MNKTVYWYPFWRRVSTRFVATRFVALKKTRFVAARFVAAKKSRFVGTFFVAVKKNSFRGGKKKNSFGGQSRGSRGQIKHNIEPKSVIKYQYFKYF